MHSVQMFPPMFSGLKENILQLHVQQYQLLERGTFQRYLCRNVLDVKYITVRPLQIHSLILGIKFLILEIHFLILENTCRLSNIRNQFSNIRK